MVAMVSLAAMAGAALAAEVSVAESGLPMPSVDQIVARYVAARGGAEAWQRVLSMGWTGHIESGANRSQKLPFLMLFRKPNATRFEVVTQNQRSVHIFDGKRGWKQRPGGETGLEVSNYTPEEVRSALDAGGLGYVVKALFASDLLPAIRAALADRRFISPIVRLDEETLTSPDPQVKQQQHAENK